MIGSAFLWTGACFWLAAALSQLAPALVAGLGDLPLLAPASVLAGLGAGLLAPAGHKPAEELLAVMLRLVLLLAFDAALGLLFAVMAPGPARTLADYLLGPALFTFNGLALVPAGRELRRALDGLELPAALRALGLAAAVNGIIFVLLRRFDAPMTRLAPALVLLMLGGLGLKLPRRGLVLQAGLALACLLLAGAAGWRLSWSDHVLRRVPIASPDARALLPAGLTRGPDREQAEAWTGVVIDDSFFDFAVDLDPIRLEMAAAKAPRETAVLAGMAEFYRLPFRLRPPGRALIINSGLGNTLAAGEREGWQALEAQETDPALRQLGLDHPERPYQAPGLVIHREPALTLLRGQLGAYDLIAVSPALTRRLFGRLSGEVRADPLYTAESLKTIAGGLSSDGVVAVMVSAPQRFLERRLFQMLSEQLGPAAAWSWNNPAWNEQWTLIAAGPGIRRYRPRPGPGLVDRTAEFNEGRPLSPANRDWPYPFSPGPGLPLYLSLAMLAVLGATVGMLVPGGAGRNLEPSSLAGGAFIACLLMRSWSLPIPPETVWAAAGLLLLLAALGGRRSTPARRAGSLLAGFAFAAPTSLLPVWLGSIWPTVAGIVFALAALAAMGRKHAGQ